MENFDEIFELVATVKEDEAWPTEVEPEPSVAELEEIDELRRFSAEISDNTRPSFTTV